MTREEFERLKEIETYLANLRKKYYEDVSEQERAVAMERKAELERERKLFMERQAIRNTRGS